MRDPKTGKFVKAVVNVDVTRSVAHQVRFDKRSTNQTAYMSKKDAKRASAVHCY